MTVIRIYKMDENGQEVLYYDGNLIGRGENWILIRAVFEASDADIGPVVLARGDIFYEWFYTDRWYNVFRIHSTEGELKGWYCNITRPAHLQANMIWSDDLALDVFVAPCGTVHLLDEDEFAQLDLSHVEQEAAWQAVSRIRQIAAERTGPFGDTPPST